METNVYIKSVEMSPNPVETGRAFLIAVDIQPVLFVLDTGDTTAMATADVSEPPRPRVV